MTKKTNFRFCIVSFLVIALMAVSCKNDTESTQPSTSGGNNFSVSLSANLSSELASQGISQDKIDIITAAGEDTYMNELWRLVGGQNSYTDLPSRYGTISIESLLLRDPDVIIEFDMNKERGITRLDITPEWTHLENLKAVKNRNIFVVGGNHTMIPGPRLVLLAEDFSEIMKLVIRN